MPVNANILQPDYLEASMGFATLTDMSNLFDRTDRDIGAFTRSVRSLTDPIEAPDLTVAVQSCNDTPDDMQRLMMELDAQARLYSITYRRDVQTVLLSAQNGKETEAVAKHYGAQVEPVTVGPHWRADILNKGLEVADHDVVLSTVAHALPVSKRWLEVAATEMSRYPDTVAAYGTALPDLNASDIEKRGAKWLGAHKIIAGGIAAVFKGGMGVLAADCSVVRKSAALDYGGYPTKYGAGGADGALGKRFAEDESVNLWRHPALSVYHTHGYNRVEAARQVGAWVASAIPHQYSMHTKTETLFTPAGSRRRFHYGL